MGTVESESIIKKVPPPDCGNSSDCPHFQGLVSKQLEAIAQDSTPTDSSSIIGWSEERFGGREIGVIYAERLPRTNSAVMSPPISSVKIVNCDSCKKNRANPLT